MQNLSAFEEKLSKLEEKAFSEWGALSSLEELEKWRVHFLGKKGLLSSLLQNLKQLDPKERPQGGQKANVLKQKLLEAFEKKKQTLLEEEEQKRFAQEAVDVSLPGRELLLGRRHPLSLAFDQILGALKRLGFEVVYGPEAESDYYNFEAVNIPPEHPARDMQDTFFLAPGILLRTHTTPVQIRVMEKAKWPVRILCPGAVYRRDSDQTHSPMFHQVEALWVDEHISLAHLKGVLLFFAQEVFGSKAQIRLRPSYFPFVEPGAEVDVSCVFCRGKKKNCTVCKGSGWLEILGAGMVHPSLFERVGYPEKLSGFAFGLGVERIAMLLYGIPDLRLFFHSDPRFLKFFI